jgi:oxygen-independent coproporphyrinogen-3 oxidase
MAGLYLHIPFCKQACYYCDFHFSTNRNRQLELVQAIAREIEIQKNYLDKKPIQSIYFGGGTPSLLNARELDILLNTIHVVHPIESRVEITLEANPDDLTPEKLTELKKAGINRLSLGIQSFNDSILQFLNRAHDSRRAIASYQDAREAGFSNISLDLIYAIPGQRESQWLDDIHQALNLEPEHISTYSLTIEEKTVFGRWTVSGKLKPEPDETAAQYLELLMTTLQAKGYEQYEVSNFAKPGLYSVHNSSYWKQEAYLGVGPGAHSFNLHSRQFNVRNNPIYLKALEEGRIPAEVEILTREDKINEYLLTTLRTQWGADLTYLNKQFNYPLVEQNYTYLHQLMEARLIFIEHDILYLTGKGKLLADKIASDLFVLQS